MPQFPGHFEPDPDPYPPAGPAHLTASARRPWSPVNYDDDNVEARGIHDYMGRGHDGRAQRMQASEDSIEALDLADYARLPRATADPQSAYPPFPHTSHVHPLSAPSPVYVGASGSNIQYPEYPPSPDTDRPFSALSRDTFLAPPSLVSGGTSYDSHESSTRRPYSLPAFFSEIPQTRDPAIFSPASANHLPYRNRSPVIEEDTSQFPEFTRGWYDNPQKSSSKSGRSSLPPYPSEPQYSSRGSHRFPPSAPSDSTRNTLPWNYNDPDGPPVDDSIKEDRIRLLEREFGGKPGKIASGEPLIGSVDEKGALITVGSKKRVGARWAQGILACGAVVSSLYGAMLIKPKKRPPPQSTLPAFALYAFSIVTLIVVVSLWVFRPLCCGKRRKPRGPADPVAGGMMVLPVQSLAGGKKKKPPKGNKGKNRMVGGGGDVQVNLIVDPSMFGQGRRQGDEYDSDEYGSQASAPRRQTRRGYFEGVELEREWIAARTFVRRMLFVDIACCVAWAAVFVLILMGKKCPPGTFEGWCDSYNVGTATAFLLCLAFGFSIYFAIVDLHKSKESPRTRT